MSVDSQDGHPSLASLEDEFDSACAAAVEECKRLTPPYYPHAWLGMVTKLRAAEAARRLVVSGDIQTGFERLVQAGRPELTIEWASSTLGGTHSSTASIARLPAGGSAKQGSTRRADLDSSGWSQSSRRFRGWPRRQALRHGLAGCGLLLSPRASYILAASRRLQSRELAPQA